MKILLVKSIFCPTNEYLNVTIKSLIKINIFIHFMIQFDMEFDLLLIGWSHKYKNILDCLLKLIKFNFANIFTEYWAINYVKYKILNYMIDFTKKNNNYENVIYLDHDIYFDIIFMHNFNKIACLNDLLINNKNIGLAAFNQKEDVRHQPLIYENSFNNDGLKIIWTDEISAIATGAFIISCSTLQKLDYFKLKTVYGLDDFLLCKQLKDRGLINIVLENCVVVHPYDVCINNEKYKQWKKNNIIKTINDNINYYTNIEESMNIHVL
jgi:hypothetical protein